MKEVVLWDQKLFLAINGWNHPFFDVVFYWISNKYVWIPLYILLLVLIFRNWRWKGFYALIATLLLVTLSDQVSVQVFKEVFHRLRPCHEPALSGMVHLVNDHCGGKYGFVSSHATNSFALALFMSMLFKIRYLTTGLFAWAVLNSYSRVYLGVHYPGDVIGGAIVGLILAWIVFALYSYHFKKRTQDAMHI